MGIATYFGRNVRILLRSKNLTQTEIAVKIGITRQAMSRLLDGKRPPSGTSIESVAKALGVEACELICKEPPRIKK